MKTTTIMTLALAAALTLSQTACAVDDIAPYNTAYMSNTVPGYYAPNAYPAGYYGSYPPGYIYSGQAGYYYNYNRPRPYVYVIHKDPPPRSYHGRDHDKDHGNRPPRPDHPGQPGNHGQPGDHGRPDWAHNGGQGGHRGPGNDGHGNQNLGNQNLGNQAPGNKGPGIHNSPGNAGSGARAPLPAGRANIRH